MELDPFGLSVKDLATRNVITWCNSSGPVYTIHFPTTCAPQASTYYVLTVVAAPPRCFGITILVTMAPTLRRSSLLLVLSLVINLEMFLSAMLAS
jgi:hypothetical protein